MSNLAMRELAPQEICAISGGDAETRSFGDQLGVAAAKLTKNPEAAFMGPVIGTLYLLSK